MLVGLAVGDDVLKCQKLSLLLECLLLFQLLQLCGLHLDLLLGWRRGLCQPCWLLLASFARRCEPHALRLGCGRLVLLVEWIVDRVRILDNWLGLLGWDLIYGATIVEVVTVVIIGVTLAHFVSNFKLIELNIF